MPITVELRPEPRVESLTGLRWFAAFAVFIYHVNQIAPLPRIGPYLAFGDAGVTFFYILSGFVLTWSFRPEIGRSVFYWRRWARVWPMLVLSTAFAWLAFAQPWPEAAQRTALSLTLVEAWFQPPAVPIANPVAWSVSAEAFFYLLFPFLIGPLLRMRLSWLAVAATVLLLAEWLYWISVRDLIDPANFWVELSWFIRLPAFRIIEFALGMIAAAALRKGWRPPLNLWLALASVPASILLIHHGSLAGWWEPLWTQQGMVPAFLIVVIATALRDLNGKPSFLRSRPLVALGAWSYAFYLVHLSVIYLTLDLATPRTESWRNLAMIGLWAVAATVLSWLCYRFFEHPVEQWLRRRYPRRTPEGRPPASRTPEDGLPQAKPTLEAAQ